MNQKKPLPPAAQEILSRLKADPAVQDYTRKFDPESVEKFLHHYASMTQNAKHTQQLEEERTAEVPLQFLNMAEEGLWEIQQKKLFSLQCLWRAEQVQLPGLESTHDFAYWQYYIRSCPFISPITLDEVELYTAFLLSGKRENDYLHHTAWQDYKDLKEAFTHPQEQDYFPAWYRYSDEYYGTGNLIHLPDLRSPKEEFYIDIARRARAEMRQQKLQEAEAGGQLPANPVPPDTRPDMPSYPLDQVIFAEKFCDPIVAWYMRKQYTKSQETIDPDQLELALIFLQDQKENIPFGPHHDWRAQIIQTVHEHKLRKTAEAMPVVYSQYPDAPGNRPRLSPRHRV
jgi:hypothetical protein